MRITRWFLSRVLLDYRRFQKINDLFCVLDRSVGNGRDGGGAPTIAGCFEARVAHFFHRSFQVLSTLFEKIWHCFYELGEAVILAKHFKILHLYCILGMRLFTLYCRTLIVRNYRRRTLLPVRIALCCRRVDHKRLILLVQREMGFPFLFESRL